VEYSFITASKRALMSLPGAISASRMPWSHRYRFWTAVLPGMPPNYGGWRAALAPIDRQIDLKEG
jgi:hypothetical protein